MKNNPIKPSPFVSSLLSFGKMIGVDRSFWVKKESRNEISFTINLDNRIIAQLAPGVFMDVLKVWEKAIRMVISSGQLIMLDSLVNPPNNVGEIKQVINDLKGKKGVNIFVKIDKKVFIRQYYNAIFDPGSILLIVFNENLLELFHNNGLIGLQKTIWEYVDKKPVGMKDIDVKKLARRILIIVLEKNIFINGDFLTIIGNDNLKGGLPSTVKQKVLFDEEEYQALLKRCQEDLKWQIMENILISPWHLYVSWPDSDDSELGLVQVIRQHFLNLFILYTADRTVFVEKTQSAAQYQALYYGENRQVDLILDDPWGKGQLTIVDTSFEYFIKILDFIYRGEIKSSEKLKIVQLVIMDYISGVKAADRPETLIDQAGSIYEKIDWQWKIFTGGKIEENWKQIQEFQTSIHKTVMDFSDQVSVLASKLTETVWSGVVVTLGSFLATIFSKDPNITILKLGLLTYAGYMILFPLIVSMISRWQAYRTTICLFESLMKKAQSSLTSTVVDEITANSQYERNKKRFIGWFVISILIYVAIIVLLIVGAFSISQLIPGD